MSHTSTVGTVQIKSITALQRTVSELNELGVRCELVQNASPRAYYSHQMGTLPYVLKLPGTSYDVGFKQEGQALVPVFDDYQGYVRSQLGATNGDRTLEGSIGRLTQLYAKNAAIEAAALQGYTVEGSSMDAEGNVQLVFNVH